MPAAGRHPSREATDAARWRATADRLATSDVPPALAAALAHVLRASAGELEVGRSLPAAVRRAADHVWAAVGQVTAGRG